MRTVPVRVPLDVGQRVEDMLPRADHDEPLLPGVGHAELHVPAAPGRLAVGEAQDQVGVGDVDGVPHGRGPRLGRVVRDRFDAEPAQRALLVADPARDHAVAQREQLDGDPAHLELPLVRRSQMDLQSSSQRIRPCSRSHSTSCRRS